MSVAVQTACGVAAGVASILAGAAVAQTAPGHFSAYGRTMSRLEASQGLGRCVARREPKVASAFVVAAGGSDADKAAGTKLISQLENCMKAVGGSATLRASDLKGVMAEALLKEQAGSLDKVRMSTPVPAQRLVGLDKDAKQRLFDCAVRAQPSDAAKMLDQKPESPEEAAQFRAIMPALQACMPAEGGLTFKPFEIRLLVAVATYRVANQLVGA
ncbi:hypothetical protein EWE75_08500 [Sphingomonas populi]|uniref:Uncharacterized protein n=1 Tax=Sphingomonas populi TaxID=2484750 RepID=A0A4Q6Y4V2_9SPHN|nr:hypothetical protein [Sphingomonas populi]RZF64894.1 hypothetical protein EWE75_08500 [Sphingomonas populi]